MPENLQISFRDGSVRLEGDLDAETTRLMVLVREFIVSGGTGPVEIDLDALAFCDSAGVYELIRLGKLAADTGRSLRLVNPRGMVERIFVVADLAATLEIVSTEV